MSKQKQTTLTTTSKQYVTLAKEGTAIYEDRKSVFYAYAARVTTEADAQEYLSAIRKQYPDATHHVYAYMIGSNITRFSDDGEPSGTGGLPILDVIKRMDFTDAIVVVVRYFGGTLLGTGGLVRAYGSAARDAVTDAGIATFVRHRALKLHCSYSDFGRIKVELEKQNATLRSLTYGADVDAEVGILEEKAEALMAKIVDMSAARARIEYIEGETGVYLAAKE